MASQRVARIENALKQKGYELIDAWWEPLGQHLEMQGQEGGWTVEYDNGNYEDFFGARNLQEALAYIDELEPAKVEVSASDV